MDEKKWEIAKFADIINLESHVLDETSMPELYYNKLPYQFSRWSEKIYKWDF